MINQRLKYLCKYYLLYINQHHYLFSFYLHNKQFISHSILQEKEKTYFYQTNVFYHTNGREKIHHIYRSSCNMMCFI